MTDPFVGQLSFIRVYSGVLSSAIRFTTSVRGKKERIGRLLQMHANERQEIRKCARRNIAAVVGLKDVVTGETICDVKKIITLERMEFPSPVISQAVEPKTKVDQEKYGRGARAPRAGDPSFACAPTRSPARHHLRHGELHLEIIVTLKREFRRRASVGSRGRLPAKRSGRRSSPKQVHQAVGRRGPVWPTCGLKLEPQPPTARVTSCRLHQGRPGTARVHSCGREGREEALQDGVLAGYPWST